MTGIWGRGNIFTLPLTSIIGFVHARVFTPSIFIAQEPQIPSLQDRLNVSGGSISFFIFAGILIYIKVPQKINKSLTEKINEIKKELDESEKLKEEAKNLFTKYENKIDKSKKETKDIINSAKEESEKAILEKTKKFHQIIEERKKSVEQRILQLKENALNDVKNISIKISIEAVENLFKSSIDKNKLENFYTKSLEQAKIALKETKV